MLGGKVASDTVTAIVLVSDERLSFNVSCALPSLIPVIFINDPVTYAAHTLEVLLVRLYSPQPPVNSIVLVSPFFTVTEFGTYKVSGMVTEDEGLALIVLLNNLKMGLAV